MSQTSSDFTGPGHQEKDRLGRNGKISFTEDERRVIKECDEESFWYRSMPFSVISMAVTQFLITRGKLTVSTTFGPFPKLAFAGVCGYIAGKISYAKTCIEKFKRLDNSSIGEALRQREFGLAQSELLRRDKAAVPSDDQGGELLHSYSGPTHSPLQSLPPAPGLAAPGGEEQEPWRKLPQSEERQGLNEGFHTSPPETPPPKRKVKKNIYGDTWEE